VVANCDHLEKLKFSPVLPKVFTEHGIMMVAIENIKKKLSNHSKNIELVFNYLDEITEKKSNKKPRTKIGFR